MSEGLRLELPEALIDALVERVLARMSPDRHEADWLRGADAIAGYLGCGRSRVYALSSAGRLPVRRDGSALVARRADLDAYLEAGGAKRP